MAHPTARLATLGSVTVRDLAAELFNRVWTLLEEPNRSADDVDTMIHAAHASRFLWGEAGQPANRARGEWQCSRVYAVLGRAEPALWHARRCVALCEEHGLGDWDIGFAWEAVARAELVAGNTVGAGRALARAKELADDIAEADDREALLTDLSALGV